MRSMVNSPAMANVEISGLQPIERPQQESLGSFLAGMLPEVNKAISTYKDENADYYMALGRNDRLNDVHREVSVLGRQAYEQGLEFQHIVNNQAILSGKFMEDVDSMDENNTTPEQLQERAKQYLDESVTNIYSAKTLSPEAKKTLYEAQLKENATYMKEINTKQQQIAKDATYKTMTNLSLTFARDLGTSSDTPADTVLKVEAFKTKMFNLERELDKEATADDITKRIGARLDTIFTKQLDTYKAGGTAEDVKSMEQLVNLAENFMETDLDLAVKLQTKAIKYIAEVQENNDSLKEREVAELVADWTLNPDGVTEEKVKGALSEIYGDGSLSIKGQTSMGKTILSAYTTATNKVVSGAEMLDPSLYESPSAALRAGFSEDKWVSASLEKLLQQTGDAAEAGYQLILKGNGTEYSPDAVRKGSESMFRTFSGYVTMGDAEVKNDPYGAKRQQDFARVQALYQQYKKDNNSKALDLLSGVDERYRSAFATVLENGGSLESVREALKSPIATTEKYKFVDQGINGVTADTLGLKDEVFGGTGGTRFNNISDALNDTYVSYVKAAMTASRSHIVMGVGSGDTNDVFSRYRDSGGLIQSPKGYSSAIVPIQAAKNLAKLKNNGGAPIGMDYIGKAIDAKREEYAKKYGVRPDNVIVVSNDVGTQFQFLAYDIESNLYGVRTGKPVLKNGNNTGINAGGMETTARLIADAQKYYSEDSRRKTTPTQQEYDERKSGVRIGRAVVVPLGTSRGVPVSVNSLYAEGVGGNKDLATMWVNHMQVMEGFATTGTSATDANTQKVSTVWANGITEKNATPNTIAMLRAANGDTQRIMDIQGGFMRSYYNKMGINKDLAKAGVPAPTASMYPAQFKQSLMLIYDAAWHGHNGALYGKNNNGVIAAMNAPNYAQGLAILKGTSVYNRSKANHRRNVWMESALKSHFKATGKL